VKKPELVVDVVIKTRGGVVLVKRKNEPFRGKWALPGGFVGYGEKVEDAALREGEEETGLKLRLGGLVGIYSDPDRDPRGHIVSACFSAQPVGGKMRAKSDAAEVRVFKKIPWKELAFDHAKILRDAGVR
jgi:8-oxo-dGTP diphosphatase